MEMNRRQKRAAEKLLGVKNSVSKAPIAPLTKPNNIPLLAPLAQQTNVKQVLNMELGRAIDAARTSASNDTMNLISSAFTIVLKEFYEFEENILQDVLSKVFEQLDLCGNELVTIDEMMELCRSYGIKTFIDENELSKLGQKIFDKQKIFDLLDKGMTEIEDLHKATGICSKDVSAFRWEYNTRKYGGFEMSKMNEVIKMFEAGVGDLKVIAKKTGLKESSVRKYITTWKQSKPKDDIDKLADSIFGTDDSQDKITEEDNTCNEESHQEEVQATTDENKTVSEEVTEKPKMTLDIPGKKKGPKITRKVEIEGDFGTYVIENRVVDCHIACMNMGLEKQQLLDFIEELQVVAGEM